MKKLGYKLTTTQGKVKNMDRTRPQEKGNTTKEFKSI